MGYFFDGLKNKKEVTTNFSFYIIFLFLFKNICLVSNVLVRKVVPTLTSESAEIYLSMASAKQLGDAGFTLVPAGAVRPAGVCSRHCIASHRDACRGGLQARRERRLGLQVPEV
jgi:hypothetical protein